MGSEYTGMMGDSSFDHDVTRIVTGDAESLRERLVGAIERMGYRALNENPIQARHGASSLARTGCSQDILDYRRTLDIGLKSAGANATRVTFAYTVTGVNTGFLTKGDRNTLTREADAVIALAQSRTALSYCHECGAHGVGGSRFCRQCGAPMAASDPPELDLLRLTADANAGLKSIGGGLLFIVIGALIPLLIYLFKHDTISAEKMLKLTFYLSIISGIGLGSLIVGIGRLRKIVERKTEPQEAPSPSRRDIAPPDKAALPPQSTQHPVQHTVTEATTGLLPQEVKRTNDLN
jgi:hypothetical protein